ncbi:MAG: NUDIX hydrolase [bacterium]|nr:NUDIX hydrolase [bacterium]
MRPKTPDLTVDIIIKYNNDIILIERKNPPYGWALPGGFVDYGETVEFAAIREAKEETSLDLTDLKQFKVYSAPSRDPRGHSVSVVFTAKGNGILKPDSDAANAKLFNKHNLPENITFDHRQILEDYFREEMS